MRKIIPFVLAALVGCSKESTIEDMNASTANDKQSVAATARTSAANSEVDGNWRRVAVRINRGDGVHYWENVPSDQQVVVTFVQGKLVANGHPYLSLFNTYQVPKPGMLNLVNSTNGRVSDAWYSLSGNTLEITYRQREEMVDRFVKE